MIGCSIIFSSYAKLRALYIFYNNINSFKSFIIIYRSIVMEFWNRIHKSGLIESRHLYILITFNFYKITMTFFFTIDWIPVILSSHRLFDFNICTENRLGAIRFLIYSNNIRIFNQNRFIFPHLPISSVWLFYYIMMWFFSA